MVIEVVDHGCIEFHLARFVALLLVADAAGLGNGHDHVAPVVHRDVQDAEALSLISSVSNDMFLATNKLLFATKLSCFKRYKILL